MNSQLTAFITLCCTSGVLNLYLCLYVFLQRFNYTKIAQLLISYTAFITVYCFVSAFCIIATSLEAIKIWTTILYVGMATSAPLGLLFIMQYFGFKLSKKTSLEFLLFLLLV